MARRKQPSGARAVATSPARPQRAPAQFTEYVPLRLDAQLYKDVKAFADSLDRPFGYGARILLRRGLNATEDESSEPTREDFEESP